MKYKVIETDNLKYLLNSSIQDERIPKGYAIKQVIETYKEYGSSKYTLILKKWWEFWK